MLRNNIYLIFLLLPTFLFSQSKHDYTWILGYPTGNTSQPNNEKFGGMFLRFSEDSSWVEQFDIFAGPASAVVNDEEGDF